jgi:EAL and modified HD-GYP domain-containing signal transduction protein
MSVSLATDLSPEPDPGDAPPVLVSRQPVLDARDRVVGYRISYSLLNGGVPVSPTPLETTEIVDEVLAVIEEEERVLGNMAHLPLTREMLERREIPPVDPTQVLLRIRYEDAMVGPLVPAIADVANRGYRLELDDLPGRGVNLGMLRIFHAVAIDLERWSLDEVAAILPHLRSRGTLAHATGVTSHDQRQAAKQAGFDWFSGPFFCTPNMLGGQRMSVGDLNTVVELCRLQGDDPSLEELIAVIEQDLGLGVRLLRYMNSAYFGFAGRVRSISQAATMLGSRGLSRWALIAAALGESNPVSRELALTGLTRARACELVGAERNPSLSRDELFTLGLMSTADAVFRMPMEEVVNELPLDQSLIDALLHRSGPSGEILKSVIAYEQGEFMAPSLSSLLLENSAAYRDSLAWARRAVYGLA